MRIVTDSISVGPSPRRARSIAVRVSVVDRQHIRAVDRSHRGCRSPPPGRRYVPPHAAWRVRRGVCKLVVLDDQHERQLHHRRHVQAFVKIADIAPAVADIIEDDGLLSASPRGQRHTHGHRDHGGKVADIAVDPQCRVGIMSRPVPPPGQAPCPSKLLQKDIPSVWPFTRCAPRSRCIGKR